MRNSKPSPAWDNDGKDAELEAHATTSPANGVELDFAHLRRQRIIAGYDPCQYVDAYKVLRTRVLQKMRERGWNTLAVTSPNAKAGNTVVAINLAVSLALEVNQTVLLVDANLRKPGLHQCLGLDPRHGLSDHLLKQTPIDDILLHPNNINRLTVLLAGKCPLPDSAEKPSPAEKLSPAEMLSSPQMAQLAQTLKTQDPSRLVVYDLPPLRTADALAFLPLVDAVLLVVEAGATTDEELARAMEHLQGVPVIGTLLNKSEQTIRD